MAVALTPNLAHRMRRNSIRARLGNAGRAPVRAGSPGGADVPRHCRNMTRDERRKFLRDVDEWNEAQRVGGVAPITASGIRALRVMLFQCMDWTTGWLDASYSWIARLCGRVYQTVVSAIGVLEGLEILKIQRRARLGDDPDGPKWVQDTNLYRFELPEKIRAWCAERDAQREARRRQRAPEDAAHARDQAAAGKAAAAREGAAHASAAEKDATALRDLETARRARGPGAARQLAEAEERARARGLLRPPESNT